VRFFRLGDEGPEVLDIQDRLLAVGHAVDDSDRRSMRFGSSTAAAIRDFQRRRRLPIDGIVGPDTWSQLVEAGFRLGDRALYLRSPMFRGDDVRELQRQLNALGFDAGKQDGLLGPRTAQATLEFQHNVGHEVDGIIGPHTVATLERMRPPARGPSRAEVREREELRAMHASIEGKVIAIDPGSVSSMTTWRPGSSDPGIDTYAIAAALARELAAAGAKPALLRGEGEDPTPTDRARTANDLGAAVCVSVIPPSGLGATGPSCAFFGGATSHSPAGMLLARLILDELESELSRKGRLRRLTGALLRETRMPAVQVEPFVGSHGGGSPPSGETDPVESIARAVATGVRRFFRGSEAGSERAAPT